VGKRKHGRGGKFLSDSHLKYGHIYPRATRIRFQTSPPSDAKKGWRPPRVWRSGNSKIKNQLLLKELAYLPKLMKKKLHVFKEERKRKGRASKKERDFFWGQIKSREKVPDSKERGFF